MKKVIIICLLMVLLLSTATVSAESNHPFYGDCWCPHHLDGTEAYTPGDTDHDGEITAYDAFRILKFTVGRIPAFLEIYTSGTVCASFLVMDVNNDGIGNAKDALEVLKYVVGKADGFARQPVYYLPDTPTDV